MAREAQIMAILATARDDLGSLAAPQAERIAQRIRRIVDELHDAAEDVDCYYRKWSRAPDGVDLAALDKLLRGIR